MDPGTAELRNRHDESDRRILRSAKPAQTLVSETDDIQALRTERVLRIAEDTLRERLIAISPQIKADVELMAKVIREMVDLEREKLGLDNPRGKIKLAPNNDKDSPGDPDLIGTGRVAGRYYAAAAWLTNDDGIQISLLPRKQK